MFDLYKIGIVICIFEELFNDFVFDFEFYMIFEFVCCIGIEEEKFFLVGDGFKKLIGIFM